MPAIRWVGLAALGLLVACGDISGGKSTGQLTVLLTDAPFPFDEVDRVDVFVVRVDGRLVEPDEAESGTQQTENQDPAAGWVTIAEPNASFNLLDLQQGATANLGQTTLPTGSYRGFRLILDTDASSVTLKDGTVLDGDGNPGIKWPSAGHSGIKIVLEEPIEVVEGGTVMVLDFDLARSFVLRGNRIHNNGLLFKPVIRASARDNTGSISGEVRADSAAGQLVANATVEVLVEGTAVDDTASAKIVQTTSTDDAGTFVFGFVLPGTYEVRATSPDTLYLPALATGVTVTAGEATSGVAIVVPHK
ncbi:MAG TPA: DUF4382 domain-containing protein [Gemmatimonadales bacterium]|nr:DUF4382 domain-containing protein [Gemmatimonadales bacterium]